MNNNYKEIINSFRNELSLYLVKNIPNEVPARFVAVGSALLKEIDTNITKVKKEFKNDSEEVGNVEKFLKINGLAPATKDKSFYFDEEQMKSLSENVSLFHIKRNPEITYNTYNRLNKWQKGEMLPEYQKGMVIDNMNIITKRMNDFISANKEEVEKLLDTREKTFLEKPIEYGLAVKGGTKLKRYLDDNDNLILEEIRNVLEKINTIENIDERYDLLIELKNTVYNTMKSFGFEKEVYKNTVYELYKLKEIEELKEILNRIDNMNIFEKMEVLNRGIEGIPFKFFEKYKEEIEHYIQTGETGKEIADVILGIKDYKKVFKELSNEEIQQVEEILNQGISSINVKEIKQKLDEIFKDENKNLKEIILAKLVTDFLNRANPMILKSAKFKTDEEFFKGYGGDYIEIRNLKIGTIKDIKKFIAFINKLREKKDEDEEASKLFSIYNNEYNDLKITLNIEKRRAEYYTTVKFIKDNMKIIEESTGKYVPDRVLGKLNYKLETYLINTDTLKLDTVKFYQKFIRKFKEELMQFEQLDSQTQQAFISILSKIAPRLDMVNVNVKKENSLDKVEEKIQKILSYYSTSPEVEFTKKFEKEFYQKIENMEINEYKEQNKEKNINSSKGMSK